MSQYLYQHKQLQLPGIGIFTFNDVIPLPNAEHKTAQQIPQHIQFVQKQVLKPEVELIDFIRVKTGKIKALAEADLDSYLTDGKTLLNIGKHFHIEGIGSLHKTKQGQYEFHTGEPAIERMESTAPGRSKTGSAAEAAPKNKKSVFDEEEKKVSSKRILAVGAMVVAAILVIIWGGYSLYNSHEGSDGPITQDTAATSDSSSLLTPDPVTKESSSIAANNAKPVEKTAASRGTMAQGNYRFVIETTYSKRRAMYRYNLLKSYDLDIKMDTPQDSSVFKLYFIFPATARDTTHIKDSLQRMYASKQIIIEQ